MVELMPRNTMENTVSGGSGWRMKVKTAVLWWNWGVVVVLTRKLPLPFWSSIREKPR